MLVTGATSGVGLATAGRLAGSGATVIIHGPTREATIDARVALTSAHPEADLHEAVADFSSQDEVRGLAAFVRDSFERLDVLINNAAAVFDEWSLNRDGVERTFAVNSLGPYLLTRLLLPVLQQSDAGRIVIVASEAHRKATWDSDSLARCNLYERFNAYAQSKLANLLFNAELARRLNGTVTTNAVHPGTVRTELFGPRNVVERIAMPVINLKAMSADTASDGVAWLATSADLAVRSGGYYHKRRPLEPADAVSDEQSAHELWKLSADLANLPARLNV